jgi:hypothetical protein
VPRPLRIRQRPILPVTCACDGCIMRPLSVFVGVLTVEECATSSVHQSPWRLVETGLRQVVSVASDQRVPATKNPPYSALLPRRAFYRGLVAGKLAAVGRPELSPSLSLLPLVEPSWPHRNSAAKGASISFNQAGQSVGHLGSVPMSLLSSRAAGGTATREPLSAAPSDTSGL